ncbi:MAG TPA: hypothetical protein VIV60_27960 [Polyangiaceae bacterium]
MTISITTGLEVSVAGGPSLRQAQALAVDAYDMVDVVIADGATDETVEIQPSAIAGQVQVLFVSATQYEPGLTYRVNAAANPSHPLDRALLLTGAGAVALLGPAPTSLLFSNATGANITVQVIVGRDATP